MAQGHNRITFMGNLTEDAVLRTTQSGTAVCNMRIAANESYKDRNGEKREHTEYMSAVLWGNRGEALSRYLTKGTGVLVEGSVRTTKYAGKQDGVERTKTEIKVSDIKFTGGAGGSGGVSTGQHQQRQQQRPPAQAPGGVLGDEDIPF